VFGGFCLGFSGCYWFLSFGAFLRGFFLGDFVFRCFLGVGFSCRFFIFFLICIVASCSGRFVVGLVYVVFLFFWFVVVGRSFLLVIVVSFLVDALCFCCVGFIWCFCCGFFCYVEVLFF